MTGIRAAARRAGALVPAWVRSRRLWQAVTFATAVAMYVIAAETGRR
ncbi:hypothetical protein [Streptomyces sp. NPDC059783]